MNRVTPAFIERLKQDGFDVWTISLWEHWLTKTPELAAAIRHVECAFATTRLDAGIGLREGNAIDDYENDFERQQQRQLDEHLDWRQITIGSLNKYHVAWCYFDAQGVLFHLPAFLIADLNGNLDLEFVDNLIGGQFDSTGWIALLNDPQARAITEVLELLKHYPDYHNDTVRIDRAISRIRSSKIVG
jgi:hypothetical protein